MGEGVPECAKPVPAGFVGADALAVRRWPRAEGLIPTGFRALDRHLRGGFLPGSLTTIGGRTNTGKSFATLMMLHGQAAAGTPAAYASLEDPEWEVARRVRAAYAHPALWIAFPDPELSRLLELLDAAADAGARCLAVDYIQLVQWDLPGHSWSGADELKRVLQRLKRRAKARKMALVVVSQTRRPFDLGNVSPFPTLYELAESSDLEKQSEVVLMVGEEAGRVGVEVAKAKGACRGKRFALHRDGDTGALTEPTAGAADEPVVTEEW